MPLATSIDVMSVSTQKEPDAKEVNIVSITESRMAHPTFRNTTESRMAQHTFRNITERSMAHQHTEEFKAKAEGPVVVECPLLSKLNVRFDHFP